MRKIILAIFGLLIIFSGCRKSKFVPDKQEPGLPAYTEKGNDVAGAYINGLVWRAEFQSHGEMPATNPLIIRVPHPDSTVFYFDGKMMNGPNAGNYISVVFVFGGTSVSSLDDIVKLNNTQLEADGVKGYAYVDSYLDIPYKRTKGTGYLDIKRVQVNQNTTILNGTFNYHPIIVSGVFNFTIPGGAQVTMGRFDVFLTDEPKPY